MCGEDCEGSGQHGLVVVLSGHDPVVGVCGCQSGGVAVVCRGARSLPVDCGDDVVQDGVAGEELGVKCGQEALI